MIRVAICEDDLYYVEKIEELSKKIKLREAAKAKEQEAENEQKAK